MGQPFGFCLRFSLRVPHSCRLCKGGVVDASFFLLLSLDPSPQTIPTMHCELYPFVFFSLQNRSNGRCQLAKCQYYNSI